MEDKPYLGRGWGFPVSFTKSGGAVLVSEEEDIRQSLRILLSTSPGERIFRFDYGCNRNEFVFSSMSTSEKTRIIQSIEAAVLQGEPRIELESVELTPQEEEEGVWWINLRYLIRQTNSRSNMVYPFYIREGTNL